MAENPDAASRVIQGLIQGVMAGISFIGAGVVLRDAKAQMVQGLTTAATVWVTAALGIACGLGAWPSRCDRAADRAAALGGGAVDRSRVREKQSDATGIIRRRPSVATA